MSFSGTASGRPERKASFFILTDTANILRTTFDWSDEKVEHLLSSISKTATVLKPQPHLHLLRDEPDNRILECALLAEATIIVSGDRHLLSLACHGEIRMLTLATFLEDVSHS